MNPREYAEYMVGQPYLQGSDDLANGGIDCFGIIKDYFEVVRAIVIPSPVERTDIGHAGEEEITSGRWVESSREGADIFACFSAAGEMAHCGLIVQGHALHAVGENDRGQVMHWSLRKMEGFYRHRDCSITYYRYAYKG